MLDIAQTRAFDAIPADIAWSPELVPLFDGNGREVPGSVGRGVMRPDNGDIIGSVGNRYSPVPHTDLIESLETGLSNAGITDASRSIVAHENGAKIKAVYTLDNHIIQPKVGDNMKLRFTMRTSHNSTWGVSMSIDYLRLVCLNGMVMPDRLGSVYGRHTTGFKIETLKAQIKNAIALMAQDEERFQIYARTRCTREQAGIFFECTVAARDRMYQGSSVYEHKLERFLELFDREDQTVFGVYNALTAWSTHEPSRGQSHNTLVQREQQVARALASEHFKHLVTA